MSAKPIGVGLLGTGTVGSAVARAFAERSRRLDAAAGRPLRLIAALVRDPNKPREAGDVPFTTDPFAILDDGEIGIVIEVVGGLTPARDLHLAAFERGKHVVTANKQLVATSWDELHEAARLAKRELRFEAAVGAAIPIIASFQGLGAVRARTLRGVLNGTTAYLISRLEAGDDFEAALTQAQDAGYAEKPDPSADVDGHDAAYKLSILISLLEGRHFHPDNVRRSTLRGATAQQTAVAASRGMRLRYLAVADFGDKAVKARVGPEEVPADSLEGRLSGTTNAVTLETDLAGTLTWTGAGAGGDATASAVLGDVIRIARRMR